MKRIILLFLILIAPIFLGATELYVDGENGADNTTSSRGESKDNAWATIQYALDTANPVTYPLPININVRPSTFAYTITSKIDWDLHEGTNNSNRITLKGDYTGQIWGEAEPVWIRGNQAIDGIQLGNPLVYVTIYGISFSSFNYCIRGLRENDYCNYENNFGEYFVSAFFYGVYTAGSIFKNNVAIADPNRTSHVFNFYRGDDVIGPNEFYNNTIYDSSRFIRFSNGAGAPLRSSFIAYNNIAYVIADHDLYDTIVYFFSDPIGSSTIIDTDNNLFITTDTLASFAYGNGNISLASWQGMGYDVNSSTHLSAHFNNEGGANKDDYKIGALSNAINATHTSPPTVTEDGWKRPRPVGSIDKGAYQYLEGGIR